MTEPGGNASRRPSPAAVTALLERRLRAAAGRAGRDRAIVPAGGPPVASFGQRWLWLMQQLIGDSPEYQVHQVLRISGRLDVDALRLALQDVLDRHEVLRTVFHAAGDGPVPEVLPRVAAALPVLAPAGETEEAALGLAYDLVRRPFDLATDPPLRMWLIRRTPDEWLAVLAMHHIATDGWSMSLLWRELADCYRAHLLGTSAALPPLSIQYQDFAHWQRNQLTERVQHEQLAYWRRRLAGLGPLQLPTDRPRPATRAGHGDEVRFDLPPELVERLRDLGAHHGTTLFVTTLAAFQVVLARWSGQHDIAVGTPVMGRHHPELEALIGYFVNSVVIRGDLSGTPTAAELLNRTRKDVVEAFANQQLPFDSLVADLAPVRDPSRTPLFQVIFTLADEETTGFALPGATVAPVRISDGTCQFDLSVELTGSAGTLTATFGYDTALFDAATVDRLAAHFVATLRRMVDAPHEPLTGFDPRTVEERALVAGWNDTGRPVRAACVHELVAEQARSWPDAIAVRDATTVLTYAELDRRASRLAGRLRAREVGPGVLVGVFLDRTADLLVALLAVLKTGAAYVPLDPEYPAKRLALVMADSGAELVVTRSDLAGAAPGTTLLVDATEDVPPVPAVAASPEDLAYVIYTSGSTGRPKGVMVPHRGVVNLAADLADRWPLGPGDRVAAIASFAFDMSVPELLVPLITGATVVLVDRDTATNGRRLGELVDRADITVMQATPATWQLLLDSGWEGAPRLRAVSGADVLPARLAAQLAGKVATLWNFYGPTETTVWSTAETEVDGSGPWDAVPVGQPLDNTRVHVLDDRMRPVPLGAVGELYLGGAGVTRGYLGNPALTAERYVPDPDGGGSRLYRTGDLARLRPNGTLEFLGRGDTQAKVNGYRIELGEVRAALAAHPDVRAAAAAVHDAGPASLLVGYVVWLEPSGDRPDLRTWLRTTLPAYLVPATIVELDAIPLSANGKVDQARLPAPAASRVDDRVAPRNALERLISETWTSVLGHDDFGVHDEFFGIGGHSLAALGVTARLREVLGDTVEVGLVFQHPTVARYAEAVTALGIATAARAEAIQPRGDGPAPLSSAQRRLWFLHQLRPERTDYHVSTRMSLHGPVDQAALAAAVRHVVRRHEVLSCRFETGPLGQVQTTAPDGFDVAVTDLSALPVAEAEQHAEGIARAALDAPLDLTVHNGMVRAYLIQLADDHHQLGLVLHHAVVDGWSLTVLWREIGLAYRAFQAGREPALPALPLQYADYAAWQASESDVDCELDYWRERLADTPVFELPADRPRPPEWSGRGAQVDFTVGADRVRALERLAMAAGATPFMALLAVFSSVLAVHSGQYRVRVGTPVAGRGRPELEPLVGCFVNTVVLDADLSDDPSFDTVLARVRAATVGALAHQEVAFEELVDHLRPERDLSRNPLFSVMFSLDADDTLAVDLPGVEVREVARPARTAKVDLSLSLIRRDGGLSGALTYATDLFDEETVTALAATFDRLLAAAIAAPDHPLSTLELVDTVAAPAEEPEPWLITDVLDEAAWRAPNAVAIRAGDTVYTHGELYRESCRLANELRARGVGPDTVVALALPRSVEFVTALLGVLRAGGTYLAVDPTHPAERTRFLLADSGARVLITRHNILARIAPPAALDTLCLNTPHGRWPDEPPEVLARAGDLAAVYYTSGSTGRPKAVGQTHRGVVAYLRYLTGTIGLRASDVAMQLAPVSFDASIRDLLGPLAAGGQVVLPDPGTETNPYALVAAIERHRVTVLPALVPAMLDALSTVAGAATAKARARLRLALVSGEPLTSRQVRGAARLNPGMRLVNQYGPTECTMTSTFHEVTETDLDREQIPIGLPIPGAVCRVLGPRLEQLPPGALGEIYLSSPGVARGYRSAPGRTAERFLPDPYGPPGSRMFRTGDYGRRRADGRLVFHGRQDDQVKIRGVRVELGEVELALARCPGVRAAAAAVVRRAPATELVGYLVGEPDLVAVRRELESALPAQFVPTRFVVLDALPRTPHGKLDRARLPEPDDDNPGGSAAPRDQLELRMTRIWERVLDRRGIGVQDDFFALGGHSLNAVQLVEEIRRELGVTVPLHVVFRRSTPEGLCEALPRAEADLDRLVVPLAEGDPDRPPLFLVHPQGGGVCCYLDMVRRIGGSRAVYGVEAVGQNTDAPPLERIEDMATRYLAEIREVAPSGPYLLAGWSFGGNVAFEVAKQLERSGATVGFLGILDARVFGRDALDAWYLAAPELERYGRVAELDGDKLAAITSLEERDAMSVLLHNARAKGHVGAHADLATMRRMVEVFTANGRAAAVYRTEARLTADIHLFQATEKHPTLTNPVVDPAGWAERTTGAVHPIPCPGTHHDLLYPPHADALGTTIATILEEVTP